MYGLAVNRTMSLSGHLSNIDEIETRISNGLWHSACRASPVTYVEINLFMQDMCKYGHMPNAKKVGLTQILATPLLILITLWYFRYFSIFEKAARTLEIPQTRKEQVTHSWDLISNLFSPIYFLQILFILFLLLDQK